MSDSDTSSLPPPPPPLPNADNNQPHGSKGKGTPFDGRIQLPIRRPSTNSGRSQRSAVSGRSSLPINHPSNNSSPVLLTRNNQWNPSSEPSTPPITDTFEPIFGARRQKWRRYLVATLTIIALIIAAIFGFYLAGQRQNFLEHFHEHHHHHDQNTTATNSTVSIGSESEETTDVTNTPQQTETPIQEGVPVNNVEGTTPVIMTIPRASKLPSPKLQGDLLQAMMEGNHEAINQLKRASPGDLTDEEIAELIAKGVPVPEPHSSEEQNESEEVEKNAPSSIPAEETPQQPPEPAEQPAPGSENPAEKVPIESAGSVPEPPEIPAEEVIPEPAEQPPELPQQPPSSPEIPEILIEEAVPEPDGEVKPPSELQERTIEEVLYDPATSEEQLIEETHSGIPETPLEVLESMPYEPVDVPSNPEEGSTEEVLPSEIEENPTDKTQPEPAEVPEYLEVPEYPAVDVLPEPAEPEVIPPLEVPTEDVIELAEVGEQPEEVPVYPPSVSPTEEISSGPFGVAPAPSKVPEISTDALYVPAEYSELPIEELQPSPEVSEITTDEVSSEPAELPHDQPADLPTEVPEEQIADIQEEISPIDVVQEYPGEDVPEIFMEGVEPGVIQACSDEIKHPFQGIEEQPGNFREYPREEIQEQPVAIEEYPVGEVEDHPVKEQEYPFEVISGQPIEPAYSTAYVREQPIEVSAYPSDDIPEQPVQLQELFSGSVPEQPIEVQEYPPEGIEDQPVEVLEYPSEVNPEQLDELQEYPTEGDDEQFNEVLEYLSEVNPEQLAEVQEYPAKGIEEESDQPKERFSTFVPEMPIIEQEYPSEFPGQLIELQEYPSAVIPEQPIEVHEYPAGNIEEQPVQLKEGFAGVLPEQPVAVQKYTPEDIYRALEFPVEVAPPIPGEEIPSQPSGLATSYITNEFFDPTEIVEGPVEGSLASTPDVFPPYFIGIPSNTPADYPAYQTGEIGSQPIGKLIELPPPVNKLSFYSVEEPTDVTEASALLYGGEMLVDEVATPNVDLLSYPGDDMVQLPVQPIDVFGTPPALEGLFVPVDGDILPFPGAPVLLVDNETFLPPGFIPDIDASNFPEGPLPVDDSQEFDLGSWITENSLEEPGTVIQNNDLPEELCVNAGILKKPSPFYTETIPLDTSAVKLVGAFDSSLNEDDELVTAGQRRSAAYRDHLQAADLASPAVKEIPLSLFPSRVLSKFNAQEGLPVLLPHGEFHNQIPTTRPTSLVVPEGTIATPAVILETFPNFLQQSLIKPGMLSPVSSIPIQINPAGSNSAITEALQHPVAHSYVYGAPFIYPRDHLPQLSHPEKNIPMTPLNTAQLLHHESPAGLPKISHEWSYPTPYFQQSPHPVFTPHQPPHPVYTPYENPHTVSRHHQTSHQTTSHQIPHEVGTPHQIPHEVATPHQISNTVSTPHQIPHPVSAPHQKTYPVAPSHQISQSVTPYQLQATPFAVENQPPHLVPVNYPPFVSYPYQKYFYPYQHQTLSPFNQLQNIPRQYNGSPFPYKKRPTQASPRVLAGPNRRPQHLVLPKTAPKEKTPIPHQQAARINPVQHQLRTNTPRNVVNMSHPINHYSPASKHDNPVAVFTNKPVSVPNRSLQPVHRIQSASTPVKYTSEQTSRSATPARYVPLKYSVQPNFEERTAPSQITARVPTMYISEQPPRPQFKQPEPQPLKNSPKSLFQIKTPPQHVNTTLIPRPQITDKPKTQAYPPTVTNLVTSESTKQTPLTYAPVRSLVEPQSMRNLASSPVKGQIISKVPVTYVAEPPTGQLQQPHSPSLAELKPFNSRWKPNLNQNIVTNKPVSQRQLNSLYSTASLPNDKPAVAVSQTSSKPVQKNYPAFPNSITVDKPVNVDTLLPAAKLDYHVPLKYLAQPFSVPSPWSFEQPLPIEQADRPLPFSAPSQYVPLILTKHLNTPNVVEKPVPVRREANSKPGYPISYTVENLKSGTPVSQPFKSVSQPIPNEHPNPKVVESPHVPAFKAMEVPKATPVSPVSPVEVISKPIKTKIPNQSIKTPIPYAASPAGIVSKPVETFFRPVPYVEYLKAPYTWNKIPPVFLPSSVPNVPMPLAYADRYFNPTVSLPSPFVAPRTSSPILSNLLQSIPYTWARPFLTAAKQNQWPGAHFL